MGRLKYLNIFAATSGAVVIVIGGIIGVKGAITGGGAKSWFAGLSLMLGGVGLQAAALNRLVKTQAEEEVHRMLKQRNQVIPKICVGCENFHGQEHGGVMLVCAIHPYGIETERCPDSDFSRDVEKTKRFA